MVAARDTITKRFLDDPDFVAFAHWNANIDNCWFERDSDGTLRCGFLDWANAGQLSVAQSICGAISGVEPRVWTTTSTSCSPSTSRSTPPTAAPAWTRPSCGSKSCSSSTGVAHATGAAMALPREIEDFGALTGPHDPAFLERENARIQLHMTTQLLGLWQPRRLGELVRGL